MGKRWYRKWGPGMTLAMIQAPGCRWGKWTCPECRGTGNYEGRDRTRYECFKCRGKGWRWIDSGEDIVPEGAQRVVEPEVCEEVDVPWY